MADMTRIFISYRRKDSEGYAGRLYDSLLDKYEKDELFFDFESLEKGDYSQVIEDTIASCDVFIEVIGPNWLDLRDEKGKRRLDNPDDLLRREIATALKKGISVIPVLVQGAKMPRAADLPDDIAIFAKQHARELSPNSFSYDVDQLVEAMGGAYGTIFLTPSIPDNFFITNFYPEIGEFHLKIDHEYHTFKTYLSGKPATGKELQNLVSRVFQAAVKESRTTKLMDGDTHLKRKIQGEMNAFNSKYITMSQKIREGTHTIALEGAKRSPLGTGISGEKFHSNPLSISIKGGQEMWFSYEFEIQDSNKRMGPTRIILKHYQPVIT
jgi:hypothetical protein